MLLGNNLQQTKFLFKWVANLQMQFSLRYITKHFTQSSYDNQFKIVGFFLVLFYSSSH